MLNEDEANQHKTATCVQWHSLGSTVLKVKTCQKPDWFKNIKKLNLT